MSDGAGSGEEKGIAALGQLVRTSLSGAGPEASGRQAFLEEVGALGPGRSRRVRPLLAALVAVGGAACLALLATQMRRLETQGETSRPLTYSVRAANVAGAEGKPGGADAPEEVVFSDGSTVHVAPDGVARVASTTPHGARVELARGKIRVHVIPRPKNQWSVAAGGYAILVRGTRFQASWTPAQQRLELNVEEGHVTVISPAGGATRELQTGERLVLQSEASPLDRPVAPSLEAASPARTSRAGAGAGEAWPVMVRAGRFAAVIDAARADGLPGCLARCTLENLEALADAARYTARWQVAAGALLAQRRRFENSDSAQNAGFLLGRIAEERGRSREARSWYARYLQEAPRGSLAGDARGRKMLLEAKHDMGAARQEASAYLRQYPSGPHASDARRILAGQ